MHAVIRRWTGAAQLIEEMERRSQDVESVIATTPGFIAYYAVRSADTLVSVTLCQDRESTEQTTERAKQWVRDNLPADAVSGGPPEIIEGNAFISFVSPQRISLGAPAV